jgi:hypothetical protein
MQARLEVRRFFNRCLDPATAWFGVVTEQEREGIVELPLRMKEITCVI